MAILFVYCRRLYDKLLVVIRKGDIVDLIFKDSHFENILPSVYVNTYPRTMYRLHQVITYAVLILYQTCAFNVYSSLNLFMVYMAF